MVKNYSDNWHSIKNTEDLTMKQMFDKTEKLVSEQDEIKKDWSGSKVHRNTEPLTEFMVSQWIRVEYLPRIQYVAA